MKYWLIKTEPEEWSWKDQIKSGIKGPEINLSKFNMTYLRDDKLYEINR